MTMSLDAYRHLAMKHSTHGDLRDAPHGTIEYVALALAGEAGELANVVKKLWRKDGVVHRGMIPEADTNKAVRDELGDVLWYVAAMATLIGEDLSDIASQNLYKLAERNAEAARDELPTEEK